MKKYILLGILFVCSVAYGVQTHKSGIKIDVEVEMPGGTASATNFLELSEDTTANLNSLAREKGRVYYDTTTDTMVLDDGSTLSAVGGGGNTFLDNVFRIQDDGDNTKEIALEASAITTGTTRTITMPNVNVDLTDVGTNNTHRSGDGSDHSDTVLNSTHRGSAGGTDHSDVSTNNAKPSGSGTTDRLTRWDSSGVIQDSVIRVADTTGQLRNETPGQDFEIRTIDNGAGDSGDIIFRTGTATGTRGSITFNAQDINYNFATTHVSNAQITWSFTGGAQPGTTDVFNLGDSGNTFNDLSIGEIHIYRPGTTSRSGEIGAGTLSISGVGSGQGVFLFNPSIDNQRDIIIATENQSSANNVGDIKVLLGGQTSTGDGGTFLVKIGDNTDATGQLSTIELDSQIVTMKGDGFGFGRQSVNLTADDTNITPTEPFIGLTSDSAVSTDRTFTLEQCNAVGRQLIIHWESANSAELVDDAANGTGGFTRLSSTWTTTLDDVLILLCDGTDWIEMSRSTN